MVGTGPEIWSAPGGVLDQEKLKKAARLLREGELVAFPTETVYGVGVDAWSQRAVDRLARAKNRPPDQPFSLHLSCREEAGELSVEMPDAVRELLEVFWPGPLTVILPAAERVPLWIRGPGDTVGLRLPETTVARDLPRYLGRPLAATSANLAGRPSPTTAGHVLADLQQQVAVLIDGGDSVWGLESTVLDLTRPHQPRIFRQGTLEKEALEEILGQEITVVMRSERPHYRPRIPLFICADEEKALQDLREQGYRRIALMGPGPKPPPGFGEFRRITGDRAGLQGFYRMLRELELDADVILARPPRSGPYASLIAGRLEKAAAGHIRGNLRS